DKGLPGEGDREGLGAGEVEGAPVEPAAEGLEETRGVEQRRGRERPARAARQPPGEALREQGGPALHQDQRPLPGVLRLGGRGRLRRGDRRLPL
ncbi:MAG: Toxin HigB, partial [uncultured Rubrobacteraceae bacterium]